MIIDFHTHIFPDRIAERAVAVLEKNLEKIQGISAHALIPATLDGLRESMGLNHIDMSVVVPIATSVTQSASINSFAASINAADGIISFGSLHPMQEDWEETLYDIKEKGLPGIKLHPEYQQFFIDSPESVRILKKCEELGLLVTLHAGKDPGVRPPVHCTPDRLRSVLDIVSGENIIAAHLGGWMMWDDVEKYLVGTPINLDTSYVRADIPREQFLRIVQNHGCEKILFATDSPWESQGEAVRYLSELGIGEEDLNKIFSENAKKLLKL